MPHLVADWILQKNKEAIKKINNSKVRSIHSFKYSLAMITGFIIINIPIVKELSIVAYILLIISVIFWFYITHFLIDDRVMVTYIMHKVKGIKKDSQLSTMFEIMIDQILHLLAFIPPALIVAVIRFLI